MSAADTSSRAGERGNYAANEIAQSRLIKALRMARHIRAEAMRHAIAAAEQLSDEDWLAVAAQSGVQTRTTPSEESREIVISLLKEKW